MSFFAKNSHANHCKMGCMQSPRPTMTVDLCTTLSHVDVDLVRERGNPWDSTSPQGDHNRRS